MTFDGSLRASDRDRERTAERLRHAAVEGRLFGDELEERLRETFAARTYGQLAAVVRDLPRPAAPPSPARSQGTLLRSTSARLRPLWVAGLALAALLLMLMALGTAVRRHGSFAGPMPTVISATPRTQP